MKKEYKVIFCKCGRVHFIDKNKIEKAISNDKQLLFICNHCGNSMTNYNLNQMFDLLRNKQDYINEESIKIINDVYNSWNYIEIELNRINNPSRFSNALKDFKNHVSNAKNDSDII